jgi:hypothetical protein
MQNPSPRGGDRSAGAPSAMGLELGIKDEGARGKATECLASTHFYGKNSFYFNVL